jgi:large subunit ribosomal protein L29
MKYAELGALSDEQLVHHELGLERELVTAQFRLATNQLEDTSVLGKIRRDIARARTAARSREREQGLRSNSLRDRHGSTFVAGVTGGDQSPGSSPGFLQGIVDKISGGE